MYHCDKCLKEIDSFTYYYNDGLCDYCCYVHEDNDYEEDENND